MCVHASCMCVHAYPCTLCARVCMLRACACMVRTCACMLHAHACRKITKPNVQHKLYPRTSCVDIWCNRASTTNREWRALIGTEVGLTDDKDGEEDSGGYREGNSYGGEDELQGSVCHECNLLPSAISLAIL